MICIGQVLYFSALYKIKQVAYCTYACRWMPSCSQIILVDGALDRSCMWLVRSKVPDRASTPGGCDVDSTSFRFSSTVSYYDSAPRVFQHLSMSR